MSDNRGRCSDRECGGYRTGRDSAYRAGPKRQKESIVGESTDALTRLSNYIGILRTKPLSQVVMSGTHGCL